MAGEGEYRVELQGDLIKVKLVKLEPQNPFSRTECLSVESAVETGGSKNGTQRVDEAAELEDGDIMEENEEDEEMDNSTFPGAKKKKKYPPFEFSGKEKTWFIENYTCSPDQVSYTTYEEIASEYSKAHPELRPLPHATIGRIVKDIWGNRVKMSRKTTHDTPLESKRKRLYRNLIRKQITQEEAAKLSESVFSLPVSQLLIPGWTVEMFLNPFGIRYRKNIEQYYVDKHAAMLEVYFSIYEEHAEERRDATDVDRSPNSSVIDSAINNFITSSSCSSAAVGTNTDPIRTLSANILCSGRVISAEDLDLWDNKSVPTLRKVTTLLEVVSNSKICFGYDAEESWKCMSIGNECLNPNEKLVVIHKSFDDILSNKGQTKLISTDCRIVTPCLQYSCKNCSHVYTVLKHRENRVQKCGNKDQRLKNHNKMTRAELEEKLKRQSAEIQKFKSREAMLERKLSEINGTDSEKSTDSESSPDEEKDES